MHKNMCKRTRLFLTFDLCCEKFSALAQVWSFKEAAYGGSTLLRT